MSDLDDLKKLLEQEGGGGLGTARIGLLHQYQEVLRKQKESEANQKALSSKQFWTATYGGLGASDSSTFGSSVPVPNYTSIVAKYGSEKVMWDSFWTGMMDSTDREILSSNFFSADRVLQHLILPLFSELMDRLRRIEERLGDK